MADVILGNDRTVTVAPSTVTNIYLPFNIRRAEIEKEGQPSFYIKIDGEVNPAALSESKVISANILSFDIEAEPNPSTPERPGPGIEASFKKISVYSTSGFTINFINLTARASN